MLTYGIPPEFRGGVHMKPPYAIGSVPSLSGHAIAYRWRSLPRVRRHRASKPQGSSERVLPWQITMDQLIFASLSHTHYWYEVGMLKVPAVHDGIQSCGIKFCTFSCSPPRRGTPRRDVWKAESPTKHLCVPRSVNAWARLLTDNYRRGYTRT